MNIAISLLSGIRYGGMTYCMNFIPALAKIDKTNEYHIFVKKNHPLLQLVHQDNFVFHECTVGTYSPAFWFLWEQVVFPVILKKKKIDVLFTAKNLNVLFAPCKTVIAVQNMGPLCYMWYKDSLKIRISSIVKRYFTQISVRKANKVIVVSQSNKEYVEKFFPDIREKIFLTRNGNPVSESVLKANECREREPFLLTASKFVSYANQLSLIEGYALLCQRKKDVPPLWFAGDVLDRVYYKKVLKVIKENGLTERVKILGLIPHERLIKLYCRAFAFVFPSTLETCPMTLIEAMACKVPIATSKIGPMPEVCDEAAIYFEPFDKNDIANKIDMLLCDARLRERLVERSSERCRLFGWDKIAVEMVEVFKNVYYEQPLLQTHGI